MVKNLPAMQRPRFDQETLGQPTKRLKICLHQMEKLKTRRAQPRMEQERKKLCVINITHPKKKRKNITHPSLPAVPVYTLIQSRGIFLSIIL